MFECCLLLLQLLNAVLKRCVLDCQLVNSILPDRHGHGCQFLLQKEPIDFREGCLEPFLEFKVLELVVFASLAFAKCILEQGHDPAAFRAVPLLE